MKQGGVRKSVIKTCTQNCQAAFGDSLQIVECRTVENGHMVRRFFFLWTLFSGVSTQDLMKLLKEQYVQGVV